MASNIVSRSPLFIDSSTAGNRYLRDVKSHSETDDADIELAYGSGEKSAIGYIEKPGGGSLDLEEHRREVPEVDWRKLQALREVFVLTRNDGGHRVQYSGCRVANVAAESDDQGAHTTKIKIVWAQREAL